MSDVSRLLPLASWGLEVMPKELTPPITADFPVTVRITMAAIDYESPVDNKKNPSVLRLVRLPRGSRGIEINGVEDDEDEDEDDEEMDEDDEDEDDEDSGVMANTVICTLSPATQFQQTLDLVITPAEDIAFEVTGSYPVHLTGNFLDHPYDNDSDDYDEDDYDEEDLDEDDLDEDDEDEDEDELDSEDLEELDGEDLQRRINELIEDAAEEDSEEEESEEVPEPEPKLTNKQKKQQKRAEEQAAAAQKKQKRAAEEEAAAAQKKAKKGEEKKVEFSKSLEKGPAATEAKFPTRKLEGGIVVEDRSIGEGPQARKGQTVGMRYIGKLKNGKIFDKNVSGKPFYFTLGKGEVIKGWDIGIAGMAVKGERRLIIPPAMAYGKQSMPGLPANSELIFDVKLVNIK